MRGQKIRCINPADSPRRSRSVEQARRTQPNRLGLIESRSLPNTHANSTVASSPTLPSPFERYRPHIDAALRARMAGRSSPLYDMLRYSMGWSDANGTPVGGSTGKALRPVLCLSACEAVSGEFEPALPAAAALELIHNFSLIHDDIQDRDELRHHRPTLWSVWGDGKAIVAGNSLRVVADAAVGGMIANGGNPKEALNLTGLFTEAYLEMIEGQYLDMAYEDQREVGLHEYLVMISRKTGALIRCAMNIGAAIGTPDRQTVDALRECGRSLGYVFQIRDDLLGVWGDEHSTGKPVGADIRRKKKSFPAVYAMSKARGEAKKALSRKYAQEELTDDDIALVLEIMDEAGVREYAQNLAAEHCDQAMWRLSSVEMTPESRRDIEEIAHFLLVREH